MVHKNVIIKENKILQKYGRTTLNFWKKKNTLLTKT